MTSADSAVLWAAAISTSGAALVGVLVFVANQLISAANSRQERRRANVVRILDELDRTIRSARYPIISNLWNTSIVDVSLATNRLLMDVPKRQQALHGWLTEKALELAEQKNLDKKIAIASEMSAALTLWYQGSLRGAWFASQTVRVNPRTELRNPA
ncbi:hypothetical protein E3O55_18965 [Cryobacterium sp. MDB1-18-2]|uniref:hypothetical protein n=1 Tax=unclassified Cryobacterium TaxID=2649013 RepID=UPI00106BF5C5|nr:MULTISPECIES: hypothetical protein [unclassified Cryobacterium]TFC22100.1 hypothetical protein E3O55_18965 [Cryobacterium sp. MDB1-18-2]TFC40673.1 hypothetical protein E3O50_12760 [Cryobacterium sp. MDB1-18-1]